MKNLKLLFVPLTIILLFSGVKATDCAFDGISYYCNAGDYCAQTQCECNGSMINLGDTCGTACAFDGVGYYCNVGDYCGGTDPCECNGSMISVGSVCTTTPIVSCTYLGQTLFSGQTMSVYQYANVPYTSTCGGLTLTCVNNGGVGTLTPSYVGYNFSSCIVLPPPSGACTLPRGGTITSGSSVTGYQASSVGCGSSCVAQTRTCSNGTLSGSFTHSSCSVNSCGGGGGGGGYGTCTSTDLICISGIYQRKPGVSCVGGSLGNTCSLGSGGNWTGLLLSGSIIGSPYSTELNNAYLWAYAHGITTMNTIHKANMGGKLIRSHMAKMITNFAITLGGLTPNTGKHCTFDDIGNQSSELRAYIKISCQLGLMGINMTDFDPDTQVTRAQFGTILSRVIWGTTYNGGTPYYTSHLNALKRAHIMTQISAPSMKELRGYVMLMMKRTYEGGFLSN